MLAGSLQRDHQPVFCLPSGGAMGCAGSSICMRKTKYTHAYSLIYVRMHAHL